MSGVVISAEILAPSLSLCSRFCDPFIVSFQIFPTHSYTLSLKKEPLSGRGPPFRIANSREYPHPGGGELIPFISNNFCVFDNRGRPICLPDLSAVIIREANRFMYSASTAHAFFYGQNFFIERFGKQMVGVR